MYDALSQLPSHKAISQHCYLATRLPFYTRSTQQVIQSQQVAYARSLVESHAGEFGEGPIVVPIAYYRDQPTYDRFGRDAGPYGQANAAARAIAVELERMGVRVEFRYPDDADAAHPVDR